ncbi:MAG TPA: ribosome small subunit-dependent GTPase A [Ottowia sp.]|uniref:ribosome small subunit-dependent GTPase A n=1 Tax=Ottowia sp. TaxID=1898956 RepID=UPI002C771A5C|nr:ribosome small subunit-dependent GTPase A [Ottowia sp.]HMN20798.1 ribosome small subunit-dependent GTPase A [Ottowia sp.]
MTAALRHEGLVVSAHGRHCVVETPGGERVRCHPRGKRLAVVIGDRVRWARVHDEGVIEQVLPRRNLLSRQDHARTKTFAANLDQVLILVAAEPELSEPRLARALIACEAAGIAPLIVLNKADLAAPFERAWQLLAPYRRMGYRVLPLATRPTGDAALDAARLHALSAELAGRVTLVLGPSGVGKSTLVNRLIPDAAAATGALSQALGGGRHTTTSSTWYWLDGTRRGALIDSPGFQEFGLQHIDPAQLAAYMPDLRPHVAACRFYNCTHRHEPGCGVIAATRTAAGDPATVSGNRYKIYSDLWLELQPFVP